MNDHQAGERHPPGEGGIAGETFPLATVRDAGRIHPQFISRMWWATLACAVVAVGLCWYSWRGTGPVIHVTFPHGYGLAPGDPVRLRGIDVGEVESVLMTPDLQRIEMTLRLTPEAAGLARSGTEFWIERPQLSLTGVQGLDTVVGSKYIGAQPPENESTTAVFHFQGRAAPPVSPEMLGGVEFLLESDARLGLQEGSPVVYRGVPIGAVSYVGLAADAAGVEARIVIRPAYRPLVREDSVFWSVSGVDITVGWTGLQWGTDSLTTLAAGGVAMATPDGSGSMAHGGYRFMLHAEPQSDWKQWRPRIRWGEAWFPEVSAIPVGLRTSISAERKFWGISRRQVKSMWVQRLEHQRYLCPSEFIQEYAGQVESPTMELEGRPLTLSPDRLRVVGPLAVIAGPAMGNEALEWSVQQMRCIDEPEDGVLLAGAESLPVSASRWRGAAPWSIDVPDVVDEAWLGASVVARVDAALIGILVWMDGKPFVAPLPEL